MICNIFCNFQAVEIGFTVILDSRKHDDDKSFMNSVKY